MNLLKYELKKERIEMIIICTRYLNLNMDYTIKISIKKIRYNKR